MAAADALEGLLHGRTALHADCDALPLMQLLMPSRLCPAAAAAPPPNEPPPLPRLGTDAEDVAFPSWLVRPARVQTRWPDMLSFGLVSCAAVAVDAPPAAAFAALALAHAGFLGALL